MRSADAFYVFPKWKVAPEHAFGSRTKPSIVPPEDKAAYGAIFDELMAAAAGAPSALASPDAVTLKPMNFSPEYGSRAHRPIDLWVSICGADASVLGHMPQVYAIASDRGLEVGFAVSIDEADYHDVRVKARNRLTVPLLNAKLPGPDEPVAQALDRILAEQGGWRFNTKTRLAPGDAGSNMYGSLADLLATLKRSGSDTGGGTVCRTFTTAELASVDLQREFENALQLFLPLIGRCAPTPWDAEIVANLDAVADLAEAATPAFDPADVIDARDIILAAGARRQGQAGFRRALLKAYDGRCAVTGTTVPWVLEAAHITPYLGTQTNHVTNGLLLRADIHTLFDLRLLRIEPETHRVRVSEGLKGTPYGELDGQVIAPTVKHSQRPSPAALRQHFESSAGLSFGTAAVVDAISGQET
jgi:hypothetical protein